MINYELYKNIISSQINSSKEDIEHYKRLIEENLSKKFKKILYINGEVILKEGVTDDYVYFIERGKVIITKKDFFERQYCYGYLISGDFLVFHPFLMNLRL